MEDWKGKGSEERKRKRQTGGRMGGEVGKRTDGLETRRKE